MYTDNGTYEVKVIILKVNKNRAGENHIGVLDYLGSEIKTVFLFKFLNQNIFGVSDIHNI